MNRIVLGSVLPAFPAGFDVDELGVGIGHYWGNEEIESFWIMASFSMQLLVDKRQVMPSYCCSSRHDVVEVPLLWRVGNMQD